MPDISKCPGGDCPFKEQCYRFKVAGDAYQAYSDFDKRVDKSQKDPSMACDAYEPLEEPKRMTRAEYLLAVYGPPEGWDRLHEEYKKTHFCEKAEKVFKAKSRKRDNHTIIMTYSELHEYINAIFYALGIAEPTRWNNLNIGKNIPIPQKITQEFVQQTFDKFFENYSLPSLERVRRKAKKT